MIGTALLLVDLVRESVRNRSVSPVEPLNRFVQANRGIARLPLSKYWIVSDPALLRQVLVERADDYGKGGRSYDVLRQTFGTGIFTNDDPVTWRQRRNVMNPALAWGAMAEVVTIARSSIQRRINAWDVDRPVKLFEEFKHVNLEVLLRYLFGQTVDDGQIAKLTNNARRVFAGMADQAFRSMMLPRWVPASRAYRLAVQMLDAEISAVIRHRRAAATPPGREVDDLLGSMLASSMDDTAIRDEVITLLLAGYDSTATALAWTCQRLARDPRAMSGLRQEAIDLVGPRPPRLEDLSRLEMLKAYLTAELHAHPSFPMYFRNARRTIELGGNTIRTGSDVIVFPYAAARDARYWPGDAFDPAQFVGTLTRDRRMSHLPFGEGRRKCIGENMAMVVAPTTLVVMFQNFDSWERDERNQRRTRYAMTCWPADGTNVMVHRAPHS